MRFIVFFLIWLSILALGYAYVGGRLIAGTRVRGRRKLLAWSGVIVLLVMPQIPFFLMFNQREASWIDAWFWPGYISLGFFSLLFVFVLVRDAGLLLHSIIRKVAGFAGRVRLPGPSHTTAKQTDVDRRKFILQTTNIGLVGVAGLTTTYGILESHSMPRIEEVTVRLPHLPEEFEGFRIAQFTDLHVGPTIKREFVARVARRVSDLTPDLIAFTGDLVDGSVSHLRDDVAPLKELSAPYGKFFVTGNHEYYSGVEPWIEQADRLGFTVLLNDHRLIAKNGATIVLAGVTDYSGGDFSRSHASRPAAAVAHAPEGFVKILLAHQPKSLFAAVAAGYDLQLSGHTHGGQFFPWDHLARLNQPYIDGLHRHGKMWVYVSRGTGYWGPPIRLGIPPEITVVTLTGKT